MHLVGIKEVTDDEEMCWDSNTDLMAIRPPSDGTNWGILISVLKGNPSEMKDRFKSFWILL
jgi:hypothetical protein